MVGLWWAVSRIARSNYADFALCQQLSFESWSPFEPLCTGPIMWLIPISNSASSASEDRNKARTCRSWDSRDRPGLVEGGHSRPAH